jgi:hypothetical protein
MTATGRVGSVKALGVTVEAAFGYDPDDPAPVWTDISDYVRGFNTRRGRKREIDRVTAGSCTMLLDDRDRRFEAGYTGGTYGSNVVPMVPIRILTTRNAVTYPVFYGFADEWVPSLDPRFPRDAVTMLRATDGFKVLGIVTAPESVYAYEVVQDQPHNWYRFDELTGSKMVDRSGNLYDGLYVNEVEFDKTRGLNEYSKSGAMEFDGAGDRAIVQQAAARVVPPLTVEVLFTTPPVMPATLYLTLARQGAGLSHYVASGGAGTGQAWALRLTPATDTAPARLTAEYGGAAANPRHSAWALAPGTRYLATWTTATTGSNGTLYMNGVDTATSGGGNANLTAVAGICVAGIAAPGTPLEGTWQGKICEVVLYADDLSAARVLAHATAVSAPWSGDLTGARITRLLDMAGWSASQRDLDAGMSLCGPATLDSRPVISLLWDVVDYEAGNMFMARDGDLTFLDRSAAFTDTTATVAQATYSYTGSNSKAAGVSFDYSDELVRNAAEITTGDGATFTAEDATSIGRYYRRTHTQSVPQVANSNYAQALADWIVLTRKDPGRRITNLKVPTSRDTTTFDQTVNLELGYRVTVTLDPPGTGTISESVIVEGIDHNVTPDGWSTDLWFSPVPTVDVFIIGSDSVGGSAIIGY